MDQDLKSERSRRVILDAALKLFSHRGYRATSVRDIAEEAEVSTGNVYHHYSDKETIFRTLLDEYWTAISSAGFPFNTALADGAFPDDIESLGFAAEESIRQYREHVALIYVDVVEFDGSHIRKFYEDMSRSFERFIDQHEDSRALRQKLRPGVSPVSALMLASRFFLTYFSVEILFGVRDHFGKSRDRIVKEISDILRHGMLREETTKSSRNGKKKSAKKSVAPAKKAKAATPAPRRRASSGRP